jgi:DNA polymerase III sliding clamp (beta) subunit (PCNA family)
MIVEFATRDLLDAFKSIRNIFAKGPMAESGNNQDCLVASKKNGTVVLESANQGLYTKMTVKADVEEAGKVVINRDSLANLKLKAETTTFRFKEGSSKMAFKSGNLKGSINVTQNFEDIEAQRPLKIPETNIELPWAAVKDGIKRVMFNPTTDEENPFLRIQLSFSGNKLIVTAKDAYRAAIFKTKLDEEVEGDPVIVPAAFFASVVAAMDSSAVSFGTDGRAVRIRGGGVDVCHPLVQTPEGEEVEAIDMDDIISEIEKTKPHIEFTVDVKAAREAVAGAASIVPTSVGSDVRLDLVITEKGRVTAKVGSAVGNAEARFTAENVVINKEGVISASSKYMLECLNLIGDGLALIRVWEAPILIRSEDYGTVLAMPQLNPETSEDEDED